MKILPLICTGALLGGALACSQQQTLTPDSQTVKVDTARAYGVKHEVTFPGKVKAASEANLAFRISGTIARVRVKEGDFVSKGQILATLDARDYNVQLAATEAEYQRVKAEADRIIALYKTNSVTPNDYDKAVYGLQQIEAKRTAHRNVLLDTKLHAPFAGFVYKKHFDANETVGAGMPIITMIGTGQPEVEINVPATEFIQKDNFASCICTVDGYPDLVFPLKLISISPQANLSGLCEVKFKIDANPKTLPTTGMTATVTIRAKAEPPKMISIPLSAVFEVGNMSAVWVYQSEDQTVAARKVAVDAMTVDGAAVISKGLAVGEVVVSAGVHSLRHGEKVKILPPVSASNKGGLL